MDIYEFLFLILPLAILVFILVFAVLKLTVKDDDVHYKELKTLNELMQMGLLDKDELYSALQDLVNDKVIDRGSYERLGKLIEDSFHVDEQTCSQSESV